MSFYKLAKFLGPDTWITSDNHWEHPNIRKYGHRPENHFELMRKRWFDLVKPDDVVFHLGDLVCFGNIDHHPFWIHGLPGRKYLLRGNHDKHTVDWYNRAGFEVSSRSRYYAEITGKLICFTHEPETEMLDWDINIHGHIHINPYYPGTPRIEDRRNVCVEVTDYSPVRLYTLL